MKIIMDIVRILNQQSFKPKLFPLKLLFRCGNIQCLKNKQVTLCFSSDATNNLKIVK